MQNLEEAFQNEFFFSLFFILCSVFLFFFFLCSIDGVAVEVGSVREKWARAIRSFHPIVWIQVEKRGCRKQKSPLFYGFRYLLVSFGLRLRYPKFFSGNFFLHSTNFFLHPLIFRKTVLPPL